MTRTYRAYTLGLRALRTAKFHLAEALLLRAVVDNPDECDSEVGLARAFLVNPSRPMPQRIEMALFHLSEVLERDPEHETALTLYLWCDRCSTLLDAGLEITAPVPAL